MGEQTYDKWVIFYVYSRNNEIYRTYEKIRLYGNEISNGSQKRASFHPAIITTDSDGQVLASCVTFSSPDEVPPGSSHRVKMFSTYLIICNMYEIQYLTDGSLS